MRCFGEFECFELSEIAGFVYVVENGYGLAELSASWECKRPDWF